MMPGPATAHWAETYRTTIDDFPDALALRCDGAMAAAGTVGGDLLLLDAATGRPLHRAAAHPGGVLSVAWNPVSGILAAGGQDGSVLLLDPAAPSNSHRLDLGKAWVSRVAWSRDGRTLAAAAGRQVVFVDAASLEILRCEPDGATLADIAWSPDGNTLASTGYGGVRLWTPGRGTAVRHFDWKGASLALQWSPDGSFIATGDQDASVHLWYVEEGRHLRMSGYPTKVRQLAWNPTSRFLFTGGGSDVAMWDCSGRGPEGRDPVLLQVGPAAVAALAASPRSSRLVAGYADGLLALWNPGGSPLPLRETRFASAVHHVAWSTHGEFVLAATEDGVVARLEIP